MLKRTVKAIHNLRVFFVALILVSFLAMVGLNPINLAGFISAKIGFALENINQTTAKVESNPYNTLAKQLRDKESGLSEKEKELNQREAELLNTNAGQNRVITFLAIGILVLLILILLNYYFDYRRRQKEIH